MLGPADEAIPRYCCRYRLRGSNNVDSSISVSAFVVLDAVFAVIAVVISCVYLFVSAFLNTFCGIAAFLIVPCRSHR